MHINLFEIYSVTPGNVFPKISFLLKGRLINACTFFELYKFINFSKLFFKYFFLLFPSHLTSITSRKLISIEFFFKSSLDPINK